jgi:hypothetical protein
LALLVLGVPVVVKVRSHSPPLLISWVLGVAVVQRTYLHLPALYHLAAVAEVVLSVQRRGRSVLQEAAVVGHAKQLILPLTGHSAVPRAGSR